jgi:predicted small secreted protein
MGTKLQRNLFRAARIREKTPEKPMRKILILTALATSMLVAACNTVEGAGKDVSAAGHAVTSTAQDAQH